MGATPATVATEVATGPTGNAGDSARAGSGPASTLTSFPSEILSSGMHGLNTGSGKKNKFGHFLVFVELIHRLTQADISCTTMARLFFFPLLG